MEEDWVLPRFIAGCWGSWQASVLLIQTQNVLIEDGANSFCKPASCDQPFEEALDVVLSGTWIRSKPQYSQQHAGDEAF
jgi:hypothetical protein